MKIHVLSDLHCEFSKYRIQVKDADIVILAGDINVGTSGVDYAKELIKETSSKVIYLAGNHEAYCQNIDVLRKQLRELCKPAEGETQSLFFLDNDEAVIDGFRFLGCTLWIDFKLFGKSKRFEYLAKARWLNLINMCWIDKGANA